MNIDEAYSMPKEWVEELLRMEEVVEPKTWLDDAPGCVSALKEFFGQLVKDDFQALKLKIKRNIQKFYADDKSCLKSIRARDAASINFLAAVVGVKDQKFMDEYAKSIFALEEEIKAKEEDYRGCMVCKSRQEDYCDSYPNSQQYQDDLAMAEREADLSYKKLCEAKDKLQSSKKSAAQLVMESQPPKIDR